MANVLFVLRVDVVGRTNFVDDGHAGVGEFVEGEGLCILEFGPGRGHPRGIDRLEEIGQLDKVERHRRIAPFVPPVLDHGREDGLVLLGAVAVGFALVPDCPLDGEGCPGSNHLVVNRSGGIGHGHGLGRRGGRPAWGGALLFVFTGFGIGLFLGFIGSQQLFIVCFVRFRVIVGLFAPPFF